MFVAASAHADVGGKGKSNFSRPVPSKSDIIAERRQLFSNRLPDEVGPNSRTWRSEAASRGKGKAHAITELETGMNYFDGRKWEPSTPEFMASWACNESKTRGGVNCNPLPCLN
jgi:hypothetical protein